MLTVVPAEEEHLSALVELLAEMDRYYGVTELETLESRVHQTRDALFGDVPAGAALLAWHDNRLVGLAAYSFLWPAVGMTRSLYLKELYVAEDARRLGVGSLLMSRLNDIARKHRCSRVEWTTESTNEDAQRFYSRIGATMNKDKVFYRLSLLD